MRLKHDLFSDEDYEAFTEKFKPKKTTDDCYTPTAVYDAVAGYVADYYDLDRTKFVRPFYPGGDYERFDYPDDCVVVDNPPFSIITKIARDYRNRGIKFFLFAPLLTILNICGQEGDISKIITDSRITYENGAYVATSFITNLEPIPCVRTDPVLHELIEAAEKKSKPTPAKKYEYPDEVLLASELNSFARKGVSFSVPLSETRFIRELDSQKAMGKAIFGSGLLLKRKAVEKKKAVEKNETIVLELSDRERAFVEA